MTLPSAPGQWDLPPEETEEIDPFTLYELIQPLGRGSYGAVYKARVLETGAIVAVKIIPLTEQDEISSIQKEIGMLRDCQHPNVVNYYGSWRTADSLWIVMEYCAGGSVSDIMHACDAALEEDVIAYVCAETLAGLAYLHAVGKVHRDIKCGNILLTASGEVKLADFGVAAQLTNTMSKRNTFIGTPHWMAPEVIQASHYDGKVDVWALGVSAIEMAERFPPRWKVNPNRVIFMVVKDPPPGLADKERWSLTFQDYVAQCLQKDARVRPTAKYLQQHKFVTRDRGAALRRLLPMVSAARAHMAEMAAAAALPSAAAPVDDGYFSWREGPGPAAAGRPGATYAGDTFLHQRSPAAAAGGYQGTVLAAGGPNMRASGDGQFGAARLAGEASGTFVVRDSLESADFGGTMRSPGPPSSRTSAGHGGGEFGGATLLMHEPRQEGRASGAAGPGAAAGSDYLAAVQAVSDGHVELDVNGLPAQPTRVAPPPTTGPKTEAQRMVEKLHNLYSGGAVVPLPFLRATDTAPLTLLGIADGPLELAEEGAPGWEASLRELVAESNHSSGGIPGDGAELLPPAVVQQVLSSPVLFSLATSLAHHRSLLTAQQAEGVSPAAREQLRLRAGDIADSLRTILCL